MLGASPKGPELILGRYALFEAIGTGGMATVHFGRLLGPAGFTKTVAIKRLHKHLAQDPEFSSMFLDEARLAARVHHPNVVQTLDVVALEGELFLVMEYVEGVSLSQLMIESHQRKERLPLSIVAAIMTGLLGGLHAAHEATNEQGHALKLIHRDVSPQNVLIGKDGSARVLDFGIAKAVGRVHATREGRVKGKLAYMPPEQIRGKELDRRADIYAASVVFWELLSGRQLFTADDDAAIVWSVVHGEIEPPGNKRDLPLGLDELIMKGLAKDPAKRFDTARQMAEAIESLLQVDTALRVSDFVKNFGGVELARLATKVKEIETSSEYLHSSEFTMEKGQISIPNLTSAGKPAREPSAHGAGETRTDQEKTTLHNPARDEREGRMNPNLPSLEIDVPRSVTAPQGAMPFDLDVASSRGSAPRSTDLGAAVSKRPALSLSMDPQKARYQSSLPVLHSQKPPMQIGSIVMLLLAFGLIGGAVYLWTRGRSPTDTSTAAPVDSRSRGARVCDASRKVLQSGVVDGSMDTSGWVIEIWLAQPGGVLTTSAAPFDKVKSASGTLSEKYATGIKDANGIVEIAVPAGPFGSTTIESGVVVQLSGSYAETFFTFDKRPVLITLANTLFEESGATVGALYSRCAHQPFHDAPSWFRGTTPARLADAIAFTVAGYAEAPWVSRSTFEGSMGKSGLDTFVGRREEVTKDSLKRELRAVGAKIEEHGEGMETVFPAGGPLTAANTARFLTKAMKLE